MYCPNCGKQISPNVKFCAFCGAAIRQIPPAAPSTTGAQTASAAGNAYTSGTPVDFPQTSASPVNSQAVSSSADFRTAQPSEVFRAAEPVQPSEAFRAAEPVQPSEAFRAAEPVQSSEAFRAAEPVQPSEPFRAAEPTQPNQSFRSAQSYGYSDSARSSMNFAAAQTAPAPKSKKPLTKKQKLFLIIGSAAVILAIVVSVIVLCDRNAKMTRYNEGVDLLAQQNYSDALDVFRSLGSFEDSELMMEYAQEEMDYRNIDSLLSEGQYQKVMEVYQKRAGLYGDTETGREAKKYADEYAVAVEANDALNAGEYQKAIDSFESMVILKDSFSREICLSRAYLAEEEHRWADILPCLYAIQIGDAELEFLQNGTTGDAVILSNSYYNYFSQVSEYALGHYYADQDERVEAVYDAFAAIEAGDESVSSVGAEEMSLRDAGIALCDDYRACLDLSDMQISRLMDAAENGLTYIHAVTLMNYTNQFAAASFAFGELGDFLDSADRLTQTGEKEKAWTEETYEQATQYYDSEDYQSALELYRQIPDYSDAGARADECAEILLAAANREIYEQAMTLYNEGAYYQAKELFESIPGYEDADAKAGSCQQPMPENGAFKTSNGSSVSLVIIAPGDEAVYLKFYTTSGSLASTVFIRAGSKTTVYLSAGTYTINAAYGTEWYGKTDLFGSNGSYTQLLNGSDSSFSLSSGSYQLELRSVVGGNVGSRNVGGASGM